MYNDYRADFWEFLLMASAEEEWTISEILNINDYRADFWEFVLMVSVEEVSNDFRYSEKSARYYNYYLRLPVELTFEKFGD